MEIKNIALIGQKIDTFRHYVLCAYEEIKGDKSIFTTTRKIEISHEKGKTVYTLVQNIEHVSGCVFDYYAHLYGWFNIENVDAIHYQLQIHDAKFIEA